MKSYYQLIKTMKNFEKKTSHWVNVFIKKRIVNSGNVGQQDVHVKHTVQLHRHDVHSILLVLI